MKRLIGDVLLFAAFAGLIKGACEVLNLLVPGADPMQWLAYLAFFICVFGLASCFVAFPPSRTWARIRARLFPWITFTPEGGVIRFDHWFPSNAVAISPIALAASLITGGSWWYFATVTSIGVCVIWLISRAYRAVR